MNNKNNKTEKFGDSELGKGIGLALVILAICIGFGDVTNWFNPPKMNR